MCESVHKVLNLNFELDKKKLASFFKEETNKADRTLKFTKFHYGFPIKSKYFHHICFIYYYNDKELFMDLHRNGCECGKNIYEQDIRFKCLINKEENVPYKMGKMLHDCKLCPTCYYSEKDCVCDKDSVLVRIDKEKCFLCLSDLSMNTKKLPNCGHEICMKCFPEFIYNKQRKNECPVCRTVICNRCKKYSQLGENEHDSDDEPIFLD